MQYWNDLYTEIAGRIKAKMPYIAWIDLWHDQVSYLTSELPFPTPAVFIGFSTLDAEDNGKLVQYCTVQTDMYLFYETFSDTYLGSYNQGSALEFMKELTNLHALFHGKSGENYSSMRRIDMRREDSGDAGNLYRISFECLVADYSAEHLFVETQNESAEVEILQNESGQNSQDEEPLFHIPF